jgi:CubicO group peptidase (beta-lactamase class C family)
VLIIFLFVPVRPVAAQNLVSKVAEYMNAQADINHFRGSILIAQKGQVLVSGAYGSANGVRNGQSTRTQRFRLGSISKQFTAAALLQLQERGKLQLQDSVCGYIAKCPTGWQEIKLFNLLVQTDGIPEVSAAFENREAGSAGAFGELLAYLGDRPLEFNPGEKFRYGNAGYVVLGAVIEKVSGETYSAYLENHIFTPLGMRDTRYDAGRLYSTVEDLYLWDRELYGGKTVSKELVDEMFKPYVDGHGFGWEILKEFDRIVDTQIGGIHVLPSSMRRYPGDNSCVIVLSNLDDVDAERISRDLAALLFSRHYELPVRHHRIALDPTIYGSYVGRYQLAPDSAIIVTREGDRLMIQGIGEKAVEILPESETRFFITGLNSEINFVRGMDGNAVYLVLQQGGRDIPARRIE